jgi:hypothetical protein
MKAPRSNEKFTFEQILRSTAFANFQRLVEKAELAARLAHLCPWHGREMRKIEQSARDQLHVIGGLSFGSAAAMD